MATEGSNSAFQNLIFWVVLATGYGCLLYGYKVMFFSTPVY